MGRGAGRREVTAVVAVAMLALAGCTGTPSGAPSAEGAATRLPESGQAEVRRALDRYLTSPEAEHVRAALVLLGDESVYERYFDSSPEETSDVRSVTKSVMSLLVGIAIEEGAVPGLDSTLRELLPDHRAVMAPGVGAVTLRQLLSMTSGLPGDEEIDPNDYGPDDDWVEVTLANGLTRPAGESFDYSSVGSHLLSAILVEATRGSVLDYARARLFDPLGIASRPAAEPVAGAAGMEEYRRADFAWPVDPQGINLGDSTLKITLDDMALIGRLMLAGGRWEGRQLVPRSWVVDATRTHASTTLLGDTRTTLDYGLHWWVDEPDGHRAFAAVGFGGQLIEVVPDLDLVFVVSTRIPDPPESPRLQPPSLQALLGAVIVPALAPTRPNGPADPTERPTP